MIGLTKEARVRKIWGKSDCFQILRTEQQVYDVDLFKLLKREEIDLE